MSEHYAKHARLWTECRGLPPAVQYDNRQPRYVRTRTVLDHLTRKGPRFNGVAFFGYAGAHGLQCGFSLENLDGLSQALFAYTADDSVIELCAADPVVDTSGMAEDGGFAQSLELRLALTGRWRGQVIARVVDSVGNLRTRVFEGREKGIWVDP